MNYLLLLLFPLIFSVYFLRFSHRTAPTFCSGLYVISENLFGSYWFLSAECVENMTRRWPERKKNIFPVRIFNVSDDEIQTALPKYLQSSLQISNKLDLIST